ncbi:nuclear transport factor 2 family protein [Enteractinococcus helveticum]|uniref:nuclear transport factor 2 family protein n=1 Tax=Enteractinococcus helveticum TaxID=1837282 RepID=UPI000B154FB5|nr:nuclear transport factor 2 family protein [Enteractinococcus helveticum]
MLEDKSESAGCQDVTLRSYRVVDYGTASAAAECFADDAVLDRYGDISVGRDELLNLFGERERETERITCHAVVNYAHIPVIPGVCAEAHYSLLVFQVRPDTDSEFVGVRRCLDRYVKQGNRWVIEYRRQQELGAFFHEQLSAG